MRSVSLFAAVLFAAACSPAPTQETQGEEASWPRWTMEDATLFPADASLARPEDGVILADGRMLVADQRYGLAALSEDGAATPFGAFADAGYAHEPPAREAGPNGVALEPDGRHVLVADVFSGAIYRTDVETGTTDRVYQHAYGVNTAVADTAGALWFTQSTENAGENSGARLFEAIDVVMPDGALYRIPPGGGAPERRADGFAFANGVVVDEARGALYLAETMGDRILAFALDLETGALSQRRTLAEVAGPDNIELDAAGRLWIASAAGNAVVVVDPDSGRQETVFHPGGADGDGLAEEWRRRAEAGEPRGALFVPELWAPLPGLVTGVILPPGGGETVYVSNLGGALVKLEKRED